MGVSGVRYAYLGCMGAKDFNRFDGRLIDDVIDLTNEGSSSDDEEL